MRSQTTNPRTVGGWLGRVLRLDFTAFDEIRQERYATMPAIIIVVVASLLCGVGSLLWAYQVEGIDRTEVLIRSLLLGGLIQATVWFLWVYAVFQVLARIYARRVDFGELTRTMAFAFAPMGLSVFVALEPLAIPFGLVAIGITLLFTNAAIQASAEADAREVTLANLAGFAAFVIVMGIFANVARVDVAGGAFGGLAPGIFFFSLDL